MQGQGFIFKKYPVYLWTNLSQKCKFYCLKTKRIQFDQTPPNIINLFLQGEYSFF